ncbi:MAG: RluA family pseudouridine synthase [Gammaproteobacteria bacterium]|nr:RluA family pseudouridine synthase [Gammaproteobacteria bacterium]
MDKVQKVTVSEDLDGQRLDNFLIRELKGVPRSLIYRIIRSGEVRINGGRARPDRRVAGGDLIRIPPVRQSSAAIPVIAKNINIIKTIIYEDKLMLIIDKPSGMAVHGGSGVSAGVIEALRFHRPDENLELVHRLDRETSGCLMIAKNRKALRALQAALRDKSGIQKSYLAVVTGRWSKRKTHIDVPLKKNTLKSGERVSEVHEAGKPSLTRYQLVCQSKDYSLVRASPETGRTHQIRVHCQHAGHSIVGDPKYGIDGGKCPAELAPYWRMMLHAESLTLDKRVLGHPLHITAPVSGKMRTFLETFLNYPPG